VNLRDGTDTYNSNLVTRYKRLVSFIIIIGAIKSLLYRLSKFTLGRARSVLTVSNGTSEIPSGIRRRYKVKVRRYGGPSVPSMDTEISDFTPCSTPRKNLLLWKFRFHTSHSPNRCWDADYPDGIFVCHGHLLSYHFQFTIIQSFDAL
jgi:hypothetical protein